MESTFLEPIPNKFPGLGKLSCLQYIIAKSKNGSVTKIGYHLKGCPFRSEEDLVQRIVNESYSK